MNVSDNRTLEKWAVNRILAFFNNAGSIQDILNGPIKDDPADGPGRTIGPVLAARILRERSRLPRRRFTEFAQLEAIRGIGEGTVKDLVYSFGIPAAEAFRESMYGDQVIYRENWALDFFRSRIDDEETFNNVVYDEGVFRRWVIERIEAICRERKLDREDCRLMVDQLSGAYIDSYNNSVPSPGYALALWFYEFDADNWFSWERIQEQTIAYFDYHMESYPWEMELRFFKGFMQRGVINPGITPEDLPVVVNWPEQTITIWFSALYD